MSARTVTYFFTRTGTLSNGAVWFDFRINDQPLPAGATIIGYAHDQLLELDQSLIPWFGRTNSRRIDGYWQGGNTLINVRETIFASVYALCWSVVYQPAEPPIA